MSETAALAIARVLLAAGHQAYFAGGCVRDLLLGRVAKDFDVATSATPEQVMALFARTRAVGAHFGVVLVLEGEVWIEVATFRHDGAYSDGRRPDAVRFSLDAREDVARRDFTINGMFLDVEVWARTGEADAAVIDHVGGRDDLRAGVVRAIGDARVRFAEDRLRMLRAVRFAARLGFAIEAETMAAIKAQASAVAQVSCERIREELTRMLTEGGARRAFELMDEAGLLRKVLPEVVKMHGVEQPPEFHPEGDVWVHTMMLLEGLGPGCPATLAWGALLHDVGKPATFQPPDPRRPGDRIRFSGHVEVGVRIAETVLERLRFSHEETAQICALVKNHMRFGDIRQMRPSTLRRFVRMPSFEEHLRLHWLDASSAHGDLRLWEFAKAQFEAEPPAGQRTPRLLTGDDLIAAGYRPGTAFKAMLDAAEDAQLEGRVASKAEALDLVGHQFGAAGNTTKVG